MKKEDCDSEYFELIPKQITELINLAKFKKNDVFYDFGCGTGKVVIDVALKTKVKKSIGIESSKCIYKKARKRLFSKVKEKNQLKRIDFWLGNFDSYERDNDDNLVMDLSDATVIFAGTEEDEGIIQLYKNKLCWGKVRIITKDIPLIGFQSIPNRKNKNCSFFMTKPPYKRIRKKENWIKSIDPKFRNLKQVREYYLKRVEKRMRKNSKKPDKNSIKEAQKSWRNVSSLIGKWF